ncbi:glycosyltransferase [Vibrio eleionomae]|uniref:glycosyltransferase n=1 Tax=Vibrio eleionomae TaxID=2653505 RepID=UPI003D03DD4B
MIKNTPLNNNINIIILNDCSPDKNVKPILNKYKSHPFITVKHHFRNKGYTRNVNKGIQLSKERDVILLNSDTIVTPNWIRNLSIAAYSQQNVGTVTAVSNGAGAFSVPKSGLNDIPEHLNIDTISRVVSNIGGEYIDVPTGNGFCLYIKRDLINDIGEFDEKKFPKGYGEENDFCMRALNSSWHNIIDTKTYIFHKRSASFKESKHALMDAGLKQVKKDFPEYEGAIQAIGGSNAFKKIQENIGIKLTETKLSDQIAKPKLMFVISTRTGGTPKTNLDLMRQLSGIYDCYALACNTQKVEILKAGEDDYQPIEEYILNQPVKYATHLSSEYESLVSFLLYKYNIDLLHIRHLAWHSLKLPQIAKELYIPVINSFHDFYTICPSVNLIDNKGVYYPEGVVEGNINPLWHDETVRPMTKEMLSRWKKRMANALECSDHFITTCESAKEILLHNLELKEKADSFSVIPHGRDFESFVEPKLIDNIDGPLRVLVPGNITHSKGSELIKDIKNLDIDNNIEFHIIGSCADDLKPFVKFHGRYKRDEFQQLVKRISPHIASVFSIWPETYCHTLTESWASGLPVVGIDYGAVGERINKHKAGWLIKNNAKQCLDLLISIRSNIHLLIEKQKYVLEWQNGYGKSNTVSNMTERYINIYQDAISNRNFPITENLGFIMKGDFPEVPPTAYVRLVDWKNDFEHETGLDVSFISWRNLLTRDLFQYKKVVIQRDAIPSYAVDWCINVLNKNKIPYIFEMDDNLLDVPEIVDPEGTYKTYKPSLVKLLENAEQVHVTNESLRNVVKNYNYNITIRPNKIFDHRWKVNIEESDKIDILKDKSIVNIIYFGSRTHQEDLNFIINVLEDVI